jgi:hypothetical protein
MTLDELAGTNYQQQHRMMYMAIVATRDIEEGEEVRKLQNAEYMGCTRIVLWRSPSGVNKSIFFFQIVHTNNMKSFFVFRFLSTP